MSMHPTKSQCITVDVTDSRPFEIENNKICYTKVYTYLGSSISNASINEQVKTRRVEKRAYKKMLGFSEEQGCSIVKKQALESALKGAILYGCESWLCDNMQSANSAMVTAQKQLLGVRTQTCTDLVKLELNTGSAKSIEQQSQKNLFKTLTLNGNYSESPVCRAVKLAQFAGSPAGRYLQGLLNDMNTNRTIEQDIEDAKARVCQSNSTRTENYLLFNPDATIHSIYADPAVTEADRVAFSRIRLGSRFFENRDRQMGKNRKRKTPVRMWTNANRAARITSMPIYPDRPDQGLQIELSGPERSHDRRPKCRYG